MRAKTGEGVFYIKRQSVKLMENDELKFIIRPSKKYANNQENDLMVVFFHLYALRKNSLRLILSYYEKIGLTEPTRG